MKLVTSNENKLKEFKRFGLINLEIEKGVDLKEVNAIDTTVVLYKAVDAGENRIVEDTSLDIEGEDIGVNIRWLIEEIKNFEGKKAKWKVILGVNDGLTISLYQGFINGRIVNKPFDAPSFGFDPYFIPDGSDYTLHELEKMGLKDQYSARKIAVQQMLNKEFMMKEEIKNIPKWNGDYQ